MSEHRLVEAAYKNLGPWAEADSSGHLLQFLKAGLQPLLEVDDLVRDTDTHVGWGKLMDLDETPSWALRWLAQFVGVETLAGLSDSDQRDRIRSAAGFRRGTPEAIKAAARQFLTGTKAVELYERDAGSAWRIRIRTYTSETPDPDKVYDALMALKPAGIILTYELQNGTAIDSLAGTIDSLSGTIDSYSSTVPV